MVVLGGWLDLIILEVFSNLRFYDSMGYDFLPGSGVSVDSVSLHVPP